MNSGHFKNPINFAPLDWGKEPLEPFNIRVSDYLNPTLAYDSYDGELDISKKKANSMERLTKRLSRKASETFGQNDDDGNPLNGFIPMGDTTPGTPGKKSDLVKESEITKYRSNIYDVNDVDIYNDIDSLASIIQACDIVITCSNTTAHLAGALNKKTILSYFPKELNDKIYTILKK
jgi:hypothetical protein